MPTLARFIEGLVIGNLATLQPVLSPILWNSIATGQRGDRHGILGFTEIDESTATVRPVQSTSRRVKALWNILSQAGLKAHVLGWYASHPAEPLPGGASVSNLFAHATAPLDQPWPLPPGTVHPPRLAETLAGLRVHPGELDEQALLPFVPRAFEVDQKKDRRIDMLAKLLAECTSTHMAATHLLAHEPWDFLAVYLDAVDHFCHGFMPFHPPAQAGVDPKQAELYGEVVRGCYRFHDMMLARLLRLAGPDATVLLVSDHGFYSDHQRPTAFPKHPSGPTISHRPYGILALRGPGLRQDERLYGAGLLDIAPTVLSLFGLPAGEDMPGRVWREAVLDPAWEAPARIPTWEDVPGDAGLHRPEDRAAADPEAERAALEQLIELGYMERPGEDKQKALRTNRLNNLANLASLYLGSNRPALARPLLEKVVAEWTEQPGYALDLAQCCYQLGQTERARTARRAAGPPGVRRPGGLPARPTAVRERRHTGGVGVSAPRGRSRGTRAAARPAPADRRRLPQAAPVGGRAAGLRAGTGDRRGQRGGVARAGHRGVARAPPRGRGRAGAALGGAEVLPRGGAPAPGLCPGARRAI